MSAEETKPTTASETPAAPAVESTLPPPAAESTTTPAPAVDAPAADITAAPTAAADASAPAAETAEDKKTEKKPVEPIYSGTLSYQAQGPGPAGSIKAVFQGPKKRFFWFGEEAPITTQNLNNFLRGEKPKAAHPAAAWSNKTGKGLLYFVKNADDKANPAGVLVLADASDIEDSHGPVEFSFKLDGVKHIFQTKTADERAGWVAALKKVVEEAKASKEEVVNSTEYKDAISNLNKPVTAGLAAAGAAAKAESKDTPKPSTDKPAEAVADKPAEEKKEEKKEKKASKSRSVSRGKRSSIFGTILGKKEELEEKKEEKKAEKEEKKEEKAEAKKDDAAAPAAAAPETAAPAATETKAEESAAAAAGTATAATADSPTAEKKPEDAKDELAKAAPAGKTGKRGSIFGQFFEKVRSPTTEKKESEVTPTVPPKDEGKDKELPAAPVTETPAAVEPAPAATAEPAATTATAPVAIPGAEKKEEKAEEKKLSSSTPKDKESFFGKLKGRAEKIRSPSSETPPAAKDAPKEETPAAATEAAPDAEAAPAATEAKAEETPAAAIAGEESKTNGVAADKKESSSPTEKRRTSLFGGFGGSAKKDKATSDSEKEGGSQKLSGIFRNPSKLIKGQKEGKKGSAPSKVDEETKVSDEAPKLDKPAETAPLSEETKTGDENPQNSIGDVVPEAVSVGQPPAATPAVSATA